MGLSILLLVIVSNVESLACYKKVLWSFRQIFRFLFKEEVYSGEFLK